MKIWLTYDLDVDGDFQGLYSWLDDKKALECGNNIAFFDYFYPDAINSDEKLRRYFKDELEKKVNFKAGDRIYIIRKSLDKDKNGKTVGSFIVGKRKANAWDGYASKTGNRADE
jgi:hypothetical protein